MTNAMTRSYHGHMNKIDPKAIGEEVAKRFTGGWYPHKGMADIVAEVVENHLNPPKPTPGMLVAEEVLYQNELILPCDGGGLSFTLTPLVGRFGEHSQEAARLCLARQVNNAVAMELLVCKEQIMSRSIPWTQTTFDEGREFGLSIAAKVLDYHRNALLK